MQTLKTQCRKAVASILSGMLKDRGLHDVSVSPDDIVVEIPPRPELGDLAIPMFPFAKTLRTAPQGLSSAVASALASGTPSWLRKAEAAGPYLNIWVEVSSLAREAVERVLEQGKDYGKTAALSGKRIMVEFSCPNTNKPLHLGHLRNDAIGESVARILAANGAEVRKVNLINDRGIHICKSMLAYQRFGEGKTPESAGKKSDHFVGDYYVKFDAWSKEDKKADELVRKMLVDWEEGVPEVRELWNLMNTWTINGINATYKKTGISFDKVYRESETFMLGRDEILKGLAEGIFYKETDGSIWVDLSDINLDKKVLLRSDGTSLYLTQDIGTAIMRHGDWAFDRLIYVVASEQQYHFKVLFHVLEKLGHSWAKNLFHLSYGMVNLPEGRMKSREGTVVDADDLIEELSSMARDEIQAKGREGEVEDIETTAQSIALAALNYYLLQTSPAKDMIFNPKESLSFTGNTGPYLQYMGARISSMLEKFASMSEIAAKGVFKPEILAQEDEKALVKLLTSFPEVVSAAGADLSPSYITAYLYDLAKTYSKYYHDNPVLKNDDPDLVVTRITLSRAVLQVFQNAFPLVGIPFLSSM